MPVYEYECKKCGDKFEIRRGLFRQGKGQESLPEVWVGKYEKGFFVLQPHGIGQHLLLSVAAALWLRMNCQAVGLAHCDKRRGRVKARPLLFIVFEGMLYLSGRLLLLSDVFSRFVGRQLLLASQRTYLVVGVVQETA